MCEFTYKKNDQGLQVYYSACGFTYWVWKSAQDTSWTYCPGCNKKIKWGKK